MGLAPGGLQTEDALTYHGLHARIHMKREKHMKLAGFISFP